MIFAMPVDKGQTNGALMARAGEIRPVVSFARVIEKRSIINAVGVFVDHDEYTGRRADIRNLLVGLPAANGWLFAGLA